ncbi:MAG: type II toxin-antitoxin system VapC family toxin [Terrimicrobiaceae bacterium]
MVYFDSPYIAKCYLREHGTDAVLDLAEASQGRSSLVLAVVEVQAVFHRHMREGRLNQPAFLETCRRFARDQKEGFWHWLPLDDDFVQRAAGRFRELPSHLFVRSADCLHLFAAREADFDEIHSNDRHLLAAAPHFGLLGVNVIRQTR